MVSTRWSSIGWPVGNPDHRGSHVADEGATPRGTAVIFVDIVSSLHHHASQVYVVGKDESFLIDALVYSSSSITMTISGKGIEIVAILQVCTFVKVDGLVPAEERCRVPDVAIANLVLPGMNLSWSARSTNEDGAYWWRGWWQWSIFLRNRRLNRGVGGHGINVFSRGVISEDTLVVIVGCRWRVECCLLRRERTGWRPRRL